jgi:hypothetical protein
LSPACAIQRAARLLQAIPWDAISRLAPTSFELIRQGGRRIFPPRRFNRNDRIVFSDFTPGPFLVFHGRILSGSPQTRCPTEQKTQQQITMVFWCAYSAADATRARLDYAWHIRRSASLEVTALLRFSLDLLHRYRQDRRGSLARQIMPQCKKLESARRVSSFP